METQRMFYEISEKILRRFWENSDMYSGFVQELCHLQFWIDWKGSFRAGKSDLIKTSSNSYRSHALTNAGFSSDAIFGME